MTHANNNHRKILEKIAASPSLFGIKNVSACAIEPNLYHNGRLLTQPDLVFYAENGELYILEYKGNGNGEMMKRARSQLDKVVFWFGRYTDISPEKIHTEIVTSTDQRLRRL